MHLKYSDIRIKGADVILVISLNTGLAVTINVNSIWVHSEVINVRIKQLGH